MKWIALTAVAAALFAVGAAPAFTADSGSVAVTVTAQAPPAPCLTVSPGTADFGTRPFSKPSGRSEWRVPNIRTTNCGTAAQNVSVTGTNATGPSGSWQLGYWETDGGTGNPCDAPANGGRDIYFLGTNGAPGPDVLLARSSITIAPRFLLRSGDLAPAVWTAGQASDVTLEIEMPCEGSNGAGEQKSLSITFMAVVP
jgi:type 1 fimbria pilin